MDPYRFTDRIDRAVLLHAARTPDAVAVRQSDAVLTYAELVERAESVAAGLRATGIAPGSFIPTAMDRSPDLVAVQLGIMLAGAASVCLDPWWPPARLADAIDQTAAPFVVADDAGPGRVAARELLRPRRPRTGCGREPAGTDAACVFFTSGSTGRPKGVVVPHRGIVRALVGNEDIPAGPGTVHLAIAPFPWDGFAMEVWTPLLNGGSCVLRAKGPDAIDLSALGRYLSEGVNSMLMPSPLFTVVTEERPELLGHLASLVVSGDRVSAAAVRRAKQRFPRQRLVNAYGPSENSILTTAHVVRPADLDEAATDIPIGTPLAHTGVELVGPDGLPVPDGEVGELVTTGHGLALGYLGQPEETARRFFDSVDGPLPPGRYYRTGDLALRDAEGLFRYRGRVDRQIKLSGIRIEPGEVEAVLEAHPAITGCAVTLVEPTTGWPRLACAYTTADGRELPDETVRAAAGARLLPAMVPTIIRHVDRIPVSDGGKVDIGKVRALIGARLDDRPAAASVDDRVDPLVAEISQLLGWPGLSEQDDLLGAGLSSLDVMRCAVRLGQRLGTEVTAADIFRSRTLAALRDVASSRPRRRNGDAPAFAAGTTVGPLTRAQRRQYVAERLMPGDLDNLIVVIYQITGPLDVDVLAEAVRRAVARHAGPRTLFPVRDGEAAQVIVPMAEASPLMTVVPAPGTSGGSVAEIAQRFADDGWLAGGFDLAREIPLRVRLCRVDGSCHLLSVETHHIAFDGWSERVLLRDIGSAYADVLAGRPAPGERLPTCLDYGEWERAHLDGWIAADLDHWRRALAAPPPPFLPVPAGTGQVPCRTLIRTVDPETVRRLVRSAAARGGPPASSLMTATALALARTFGIDELCLGTPTSGRLHPAFDDVVGYFVNTLAVPVRSILGQEPEALLAATAATAVGCLEHAGIPFDELVRALRPAHRRAPWYQAMAVLQAPRPEGELAPGVTLTSVTTSQPLTRREWTLQAFPRADGSWELLFDGRSDTVDDATATRTADEVVIAMAELAKLG